MHPSLHRIRQPLPVDRNRSSRRHLLENAVNDIRVLMVQSAGCACTAMLRSGEIRLESRLSAQKRVASFSNVVSEGHESPFQAWLHAGKAPCLINVNHPSRKSDNHCGSDAVVQPDDGQCGTLDGCHAGQRSSGSLAISAQPTVIDPKPPRSCSVPPKRSAPRPEGRAGRRARSRSGNQHDPGRRAGTGRPSLAPRRPRAPRSP